jgi:hypothetical protein
MNITEFMKVRAERALEVQLLGVRFNMQPLFYREHVLKYYKGIDAGASKAEGYEAITKCIKDWIGLGGKFLMGEKILNANDDVLFNAVSCHFLIHGPLFNYACKPVSKPSPSLVRGTVDKVSTGARPENKNSNTPYTDLMDSTRRSLETTQVPVPTNSEIFMSSIMSGIADTIKKGTSIGQSDQEQTVMAATNINTATKANQHAIKEIMDKRQVAAVPVQTTTAATTIATIPAGNNTLVQSEKQKEKYSATSNKGGASTAAATTNKITSATAASIVPNAKADQPATKDIPNTQKPSEAPANRNPGTADARAQTSNQNPNVNSNAMTSTPSTAFALKQALIQRSYLYSQPRNQRFAPHAHPHPHPHPHPHSYPPGNAGAMPMPMRAQFATMSPQYQYIQPYPNQQMQFQQQMQIQQQMNVQQMHNFNNFHHNPAHNHAQPMRTPPKPATANQYPSPGDMTAAVQSACRNTASHVKEHSKSAVKKRSLRDVLGDDDFHDTYHSTKQRLSSPIIRSVAEIQSEVEKGLQMFKKPWGVNKKLRDEKARSIIDQLTTRAILKISSTPITWAASS